MAITIKDYNADNRILKTTEGGGAVHTPHHIVDEVLVSALPAGAATEATLSDVKGDTADIQDAVELLETTVYVDDADWTDSTSKHLLVGGLYQSSPQSVTDGDVAPIQIDVNGRVGVALSPTDNAVLDTIDADTSAMAVDLAAMEVLSTAANALLTTIDADTSALFGCVDGTDLKVDVKDVTGPATVFNGHTAVASAGTAVTLVASQAIKSGVTVKALSANTGLIFVGKSTVENASGAIGVRGIELNAKESVFVEIDDINKVYVDAAVSGEGVGWVAS